MAFSDQSRLPENPFRQEERTINSFLAPAASLAAFGVMAFIYTTTLLYAIPMGVEDRETLIFLLGILGLPLLCAALKFLLSRMQAPFVATALEGVTIWAAITTLLCLGLTSVFAWMGQTGADTWPSQAKLIIFSVLIIHAALIFGIVILGRFSHSLFWPDWLNKPSLWISAFATTFLFAAFALFWVDPSDVYFNALVHIFFDPRITIPNISTYAIWSIAAGAASATGIILLARLEDKTLSIRGSGIARYYPAALALTVLATFLVYFDFSIPINASHYICNVGPALAVLEGATPMVDAFSQYGPGPIWMTALAFILWSPSFGAAGLMVQFFNLAFCLIWLVCLYRMSRLKLTALALGFLSIGLMYAGWSDGVMPAYFNLHATPSPLGFRYLPSVLMVLAISCLRPGKRFSVWTALATIMATMWSVETLVFALGIHIGFLGLAGLRDRAPIRMCIEGILACLPIAAGVTLMAFITLLRAGAFPDYAAYFEFLITYNMSSDFWSRANKPTFFGWMVPLAILFVTMALAWSRVIEGKDSSRRDIALMWYAPMALLAAVLATYFVGRSIPVTLTIAILPLAALCIPYGVELIAKWSKGRFWFVTLSPAIILTWIAGYTAFSLTRPDSSYYFYLQECRDRGHCSPASLAAALSERLSAKHVLYKIGGRRENDDESDDEFVVRDSVRLMHDLAARQHHVMVLLGPVAVKGGLRWDSAAEISLMHAGKWHYGPRSLTASDDLSARIVSKVLAAIEPLSPGELVLVRKNEEALGPMETAILAKVRRQNVLCPVPDPSVKVQPYIVAGEKGCTAQPDIEESATPAAAK